ncbi:L-fucose mutarotase [Paenibacillus glucanolyticus]|jgi:L-fucose mutarotase|uniref:L-fucose mutarotase n=1 Tax=Paenibacillus TaxID=44249 RepID=UPI0003E2258C|nr:MULTISPECIES: L-fucose mutarotase [Paenibacillus]ANA82897.1 fucose isomerase [Paenibacillus glucanolyticus]AVV58016.1 L-fucose mutarotase [Paenibacillus glucanolyticus]ETT34818.1 RbsD or FucU transport [Paenibacillus sp. FSL R5-808]MPY18380.1 L-fucose mutarotase [Paenibacillus glucanolyticus]OMF83487.1 fucose isomerase [Paenibacillus glucanolyticus]
MLKGISNVISPDLLKILMEMGHADEIVLGDANFPAASHARRLVRADGHGIPALLSAILPLFPLDTYVESPVALMAVMPGDTVQTPIWEEYRGIVREFHAVHMDFKELERFAFYERAKNAYAVVSTGEKALYANIILKKGVVI